MAGCEARAGQDTYQAALEQLIEVKVAAGGAQVVPDRGEAPAGRASGEEVIDLLSALQRSVEKARAARGEPAQVSEPAPATKRARSAPARAAARTPTSDDSGRAVAQLAGEPSAAASTKQRAGTRRSTAQAQPDSGVTARKARTKAS
ncbi:MAG: hypothetical protein HHJ10_04190 [Cellulomonas sp.]|uniref:hypothetical protein n=1 Tax=Cellulomonas sp. TaxID=40001 RepID=UPI0017BD09F5|nr:hypothetical protein [Cellulomonas sp.]NMM30247.1 hypothetical protein [Cellulomonas sp.]